MNVQSETTPNAKLLANIARYITYLMKVFGVINTDETIGFPMEGGQTANTVRTLCVVIMKETPLVNDPWLHTSSVEQVCVL